MTTEAMIELPPDTASALEIIRAHVRKLIVESHTQWKTRPIGTDDFAYYNGEYIALSQVLDYLILCHAQTTPLKRSLTDEIVEALDALVADTVAEQAPDHPGSFQWHVTIGDRCMGIGSPGETLQSVVETIKQKLAEKEAAR